MKRVVCGAWMMCVVLGLGCDGKKAASKADAAPDEPSPAAAVVTREEVKATGPAEIKLVEEARARAVLDAWVKAQNDGSFEAYQALYAERFSGIKRVGARQFSYDRAGWLTDRERMFKKAMEVSVEDVVFTLAAQSVTVSFVQTWSSGSYRDVGRKQMVLAVEAGALRIGREELLESERVGEARAVEWGRETFGFASMGEQDELMWVMPQAITSEWIGEGDTSMLVWGRSALAPLAADKLDSSLKALEGQEVAFFSMSGETCKGKITGFRVLGEVVPHFGEEQRWRGEFEDPAWNDEQVAQAVLSLAAHEGLRLVALTDAKESGCGGVFWGRLAAQERVVSGSVALKQTQDEALVSRAEAEIKRLKGYIEIQRSFIEQEEAASGDWHRWDGATLWVQAGTHTDGEQWVMASARAGMGCGAFGGQFWALWRVSAQGGWTLLSDGAVPGETPSLHSVVDVDGDGVWDAVGPEHVVRRVGGTWRVVESIVPPFLDCPC